MARITMRRGGVPRPSKRAVLTTVLVVVLAALAYTRRDDVLQVVAALSQGAVVPLAAAAVFELCRVVFHGLAYTRSFKVIGATVPLGATVPAWFKAVFMNTVLPSGGTSGLACVIEVARRRGVATGSATTATLFTQTCFYLAMFCVILLGFWVMAGSGTLTGRDVAVGSVMGVAAMAFVVLLAAGHLVPGRLQRGLRRVERLVAHLCNAVPFIKNPPAPWVDNLVHSFSTASTALVRSPKRSATVFAAMAVAMAFDALSFAASGYAFGVTRLDALFGAYVTALVFNSFNVTPGGAGIVEGLAAAVLAGYGYPLAQALSCILAYRAFVYWIPLVVGGVLMRVGRSDASVANPEVEAGVEDARDAVLDGVAAEVEPKSGVWGRVRRYAATEAGIRALLSASVMVAAALGGIASSGMEPDPLLFEVVSNVVLGWHPFPPEGMVACSALVLACVPGVVLRDAGNWLASLVALLCLGFSCVLAAHGSATVVLTLGALACLAVWNDVFARHPYQVLWLRLRERRRRR